MVQKFPLYYAPANEERMIHLYLPDEYYDACSAEVRYPVIYMFDGHNLFYDKDATYGKSWGLKDFLDHWHKKVIVVGMECSHTGHDRIKEYCPYRIKTRFAGVVDGIGDETMQWIVNVVKPYIDANFRTWSHREATAIAGSSMGGMMALYGVLRYNDVFSKSAAVSPAFFDSLPLFLKELSHNHPHPDTRLFMSWGTEEDYRGLTTKRILRMESAAQKHGVRTWLYNQQGGHHCEADWETQVPTWMQFLWM